jgi:hypothetical protein
VLLEEPDRRMYLRRFRRPNLENIQRQSLFKAVNAAARKIVYCPYCAATNGAVKKAGALKIIHDKFRAKKTAEEMEAWKKTFASAVEAQKELSMYINKAVHEDLNPLKVLDLFKRISNEVSPFSAGDLNVLVDATARIANSLACVRNMVVRKNLSGSTSPCHQYASDHPLLKTAHQTKMTSQ